MTRLFTCQRRLRFTRSVESAFHWFAVGSALAAAGLIILWNWNYVPGPWQWLANAGRPRELLWLPLLLALGGFASRWFVLPSPRAAAYRLDQLMDSQERLLTAVDWLVTEKPRTQSSERLLKQAADLLKDEKLLARMLKKFEPIKGKSYAKLLSCLFPLALLYWLPAHVILPPDSALWMGEGQVDQLTEELLKELEDTGELDNPEEKLEKLLEQLKNQDQKAPDDQTKTARKDLQQLVDRMRQQAEAEEKARELLETLAERARQGQPMSEKDKQALEALRRNLGDKSQQEKAAQAQESWEQGDNETAAEAMESLQQELGQSAEQLEQSAGEAAAEGGLEGDGGQDFDEAQGDQFDGDGNLNGEGQGQGGAGQGQGQGGQGAGEGDTEGEGLGGAGVGKGTTLEDEGGQGGATGRQSLRRSDDQSEWLEEFENLHPPERTEYETAQTRVRGQVGDEGPRFKTPKEGRGAVTEPATIDGAAGILHYRESAENAILRDEVPADYRDNVRVYFEALDKGR